MSSATTIIIADDHPLFRAALKEAVSQLLVDVEVVEASDVAQLEKVLKSGVSVDLLLLDLHMPGAEGFSTLMAVRTQFPAIPVAVVSAAEEPRIIRRALNFGASAYIPKSSSMDTIGMALKTVLDGGMWSPPTTGDVSEPSEHETERELIARVASLTPQQFRVLRLLADGRLNKQIAVELDVSEATVKAHVTAILRKLGLFRRTQVALLAQRLLAADAEALEFPEADSEDDDA